MLLSPQSVIPELDRLLEEAGKCEFWQEADLDAWRADAGSTLRMALGQSVLILEFNRAGETDIVARLDEYGPVPPGAPNLAEVRAKVKVLEKIKRLIEAGALVPIAAAPPGSSARPAGGSTIAPVFYNYGSTAYGGAATATASARTDVVVDWSPAFEAAQAFPEPEREETIKLLEQIRDELRSQKPEPSRVRAALRALLAKGPDFGLKLLSVLLQHPDKLLPFLQ